MGGIQSRLKALWVGVEMILELDGKYQALLKRAEARPGLPVQKATESYWLDEPPYPDLVEVQSDKLAEQADVVIIGSGITGAAVARAVLQEDQGDGAQARRRIVVLEARSLCSGATGRNGGHMKASPHECFADMKQRFGPERAAALTRFQLAHVQVLAELCKDNCWDAAECREVTTSDLFLDPECREQAFQRVKDMQEWVPECEVEMLDAATAHKKLDVNKFVVGAISYTAGALWPYRLVVSVWKGLVEEYGGSISLETNTPVVDITTGGKGQSAYEIVTKRGTIRCDHVVHATNAFASQFVPGLRGKVTGLVAHMSAQRPGKAFPEYNGSRSWSVYYGKGYDYVTQRPTVYGVPGDIMLGGGFARGKDGGLGLIGRYDDSAAGKDALTVSHISAVLPTLFQPKWGEDQKGGRMKRVWTGIVAITGDGLPFVGRLDASLTGREAGERFAASASDVEPGEWISAGYCGDGMVWAWLCGTAVGLMLMGRDDVELPARPGRPPGRMKDWFPNELLTTLQRVKETDLVNMAHHL